MTLFIHFLTQYPEELQCNITAEQPYIHNGYFDWWIFVI